MINSMQELQQVIAKAAKDIYGQNVEVELTRPDEKFGDYATNVALKIASKTGDNPRQVAQKIIEQIAELPILSKVESAGPGFINFTISDDALKAAAQAATELPTLLKGQEVLVEFGDPNPFKEMHIGHLYSYIVGDSISKLLEAAGATVQRLSYHGDVGLHIAKAIWGMQKTGVYEELLEGVQPAGKIGTYYAEGAQAYESDVTARAEIDAINQHVYKQDDPVVNQLYEWGRGKSFDYFDQILKGLDVKNDKRYLESQTAGVGIKLVRQHLGEVFKESDGAIIYDGEKKGLHTRVFITSKGLPTYEAKDLGLAELKNKDFPKANRSIIITANEQTEYFKVMLAALEDFDKDLADKTTHLAHGFLSLSSGKMSSRTGDVFSAKDLLNTVRQAAEQQFPDTDKANKTDLAAVKYGFLKCRLGTDIVYDVTESVSLEGNSGPYIQYAHARASSILAKAANPATLGGGFDDAERSLVRKISEFPEVVVKAMDELMPHHICTYLYELAQKFNQFYENSRVIGDERQEIRLGLVKTYADVLKTGLGLLNIQAPEKM
jgi:arginyl-tRNA synthetase